MDRQRYHEIDVLKCVSILTVVYIHSISTAIYPSDFMGRFWNDVTRFAVPGLFFAAGFLFDKDKFSTGMIFKKKIIRLLPPYVFCSLCIQFLNLPGLFVRLENLDAKQLVFNLIFGSTLGIYYFVFVLVYLYVFSLILRSIPNKWILMIWGIAIVLTILFFAKIFFIKEYSFFFLARHPLVHSLSYLTGWVFSLYYKHITAVVKRNMTLIFLTAVILDMMLLAYSRMAGGNFKMFPVIAQFHIFMCILLLLILGIKTMKHQNIAQFFSHYSYGIFLLHFPIVRTCQLVYPEISASYSFAYAFVSWIAGVSISIIIIFAVKKISGRYSTYLVGC